MSSTFHVPLARQWPPAHQLAATTAPPLLPRFGGPNAVIIAELYTDAAQHFHLPPILYLVDTVAIPARYQLHALSDCGGAGRQSRLADQLVAVATGGCAPGSWLVLGPRLQRAVPVAAVRQRLLSAGIVGALVEFDALKRLDGAGPERRAVFDVTDNFAEMSRRPVVVCRVACRLLGAWLEETVADSEAGSMQTDGGDWWLAQRGRWLLQQLLDVANALGDQRQLERIVTTGGGAGGAALDGGGEQVSWWLLLGVYSAL